MKTKDNFIYNVSSNKPIQYKNIKDKNFLQNNQNLKEDDVVCWKFRLENSKNTYAEYFVYTKETGIQPKFYTDSIIRDSYTNKQLDIDFDKYVSQDDATIAVAKHIKNSVMHTDLKEWATSFLNIYSVLKKNIEESDFATKQSFVLHNGEVLNFELCFSTPTLESFNDIDYYLASSKIAYSDNTLSNLACNIVGQEILIKQEEKSKTSLISYYKEFDIASKLAAPFYLRTDSDSRDLDYFSDWHKDIFGYRPRGLDNGVEKLLKQESKDNNIEINEEKNVEEPKEDYSED